MSDVFRFTVIRPAHRVEPALRTSAVLPAYPKGLSPFAGSLLQMGREAGRREAAAFLKHASYVAGLNELDLPIAALDRALLPPFLPTAAAVRAQVALIFGSDARGVVQDKAFEVARGRLADSLLAAARAPVRRAPGQECLVRGLQLCAALEVLADPAKGDADLESALRAIVVLPRLGAKSGEAAVPTPLPAMPVARLAEVGQLRAAATELQQVFRRKRIRAQAQGKKLTTSAKSGSADRLELRELAMLSEGTRTVLAALQLPRVALHLPTLIANLQEYINVELSETWRALPPYLIPPVLAPQPVPTTTGKVRIAGVGDLMVVRDRVKRYELGELAYIENALRGESFGRTFRRKEGAELIELDESETTQSSEHDLQSTTKYELKNEAERTLQEDLKFEAGLDVTVTGPSVEVGANAGFSYERSSEEAVRTASTFARDVVDRSVSRVQERVLRRRQSKTFREIEEVSEHRIDNSAASDHMRGLYRWVDKIHEAQIINYGQRLIIEFVVPEPAAFYRTAVDQQRVPGVQEAPPNPPRIIDEATGRPRPLRVDDIDEGSYLSWVSEYAVTGVAPAPAASVFVSTALEQGARDASTESTSHVLEQGGLKVEPGYVAAEIALDWAGEHDAPGWLWEVIVGTHEFKHGSGAVDRNNYRLPLGPEDAYDGMIPVSMVCKFFGAFTVNIVVRCDLTPARLEQWRLETFKSIMARYAVLQAEYDDRVSALRIRGASAIASRTPGGNREIERNELKRLSIAMVSGQNFDLFDAMRHGAAPLFYPEVTNLAEAQAEGDYIQFLEQAFEWRHMSYVFYPYFWGRKPGWIDTLNQQDPDPQFVQFLRAGAARVQVPVRPGFVEAVKFFLEEGRPWNGGEPPQYEDSTDSDDPPFVPIIQELREQTGDEFEDGPGTLALTPGSARLRGTDTRFHAVRDVQREIRIAGRVYCIARVIGADDAELTSPWDGDAREMQPYALGPHRVGQAWEVRLPTTLVMLQADATLPTF